MRLKAFAKINLSLRVFDKRPDGFHAIESVMQSVSLCDYVTLTSLKSGIEVICNDTKVPQGKENLAYKAAELFLEQSSDRAIDQERGIRIHIEKNIPMAAGLAGGSADAAAVLCGLNQFSALRLSAVDLINMGAQVGSDIPFCLTGGTCLVKGRGEVVEKVAPWPKTYFVLVCPDLQVSTKWAYEEFDRLHIEVAGEIKNDLEPGVVSKHDIISEIKEKLVKLGCSEAQMSGSGPSVFGMLKDKAAALDIFAKIKEEYPRAFFVETVDKGVKIVND